MVVPYERRAEVHLLTVKTTSEVTAAHSEFYNQAYYSRCQSAIEATVSILSLMKYYYLNRHG